MATVIQTLLTMALIPEIHLEHPLPLQMPSLNQNRIHRDMGAIITIMAIPDTITMVLEEEEVVAVAMATVTAQDRVPRMDPGVIIDVNNEPERLPI